LVIVLAFLVLVSIFILGFLSSVQRNQKYTKTTANTASANQLSDSAVSLVMSQIIEATRGGESSSGGTTGEFAWASQPGMIRVYDQTASDTAKKAYKLYSSDQMVIEGDKIDPDAEVPEDWAANTAIYTDLNEPVLGADPGGLIQPDPNKSDKYTAIYPIVDPFAEKISGGRPLVDGFKFTKRPGFGSSSLPPESYDPTQKPGSGSTSNPAPMPVKWLYMLQDGSIEAASPGGAGSAKVAGATATNPIVGRIAFWTDDETAKININTASEGVYWDLPRVASDEDTGDNGGGNLDPGTQPTTPGLALCQPANAEFQRYPGHPATTCLSVVFGSPEMGLISPVPDIRNSYAAITSGNLPKLADYYKIAPRIPNMPDKSGNWGSSGGLRIPNQRLVADTDRLYASIDELMFTPTFAGGQRRPTRQMTTQVMTNPLAKKALERARFFITANSSAPEVTLFNTPRVSMWPVFNTASKNLRTAFDQLSAFCSSTGTSGGTEHDYFITRSPTSARSMTADAGGRNGVLYDYVLKEMSTTIPGFGGKFSTKYPQDYDQILASIFDYIRCTNLSDTTNIPGSIPATPFVKAPAFDIPPDGTKGAGEVLPLRIHGKQGFGRWDTVTEFDIVIFKDSATSLQAFVAMGFGTPMMGNIGYQSGLKYRIQGLEQLKINGASMNLPADATNYIATSDLQTNHGRGLGGVEGPAMAFMNSQWSPNNNDKEIKYRTGDPGLSAWRTASYPFASSAGIALPGQTFTLTGGTITITIMPQESSDVIQTITLEIPTASDVKTPTTIGPTFADRKNIGRDNVNTLINANDTVLAMQIAGGTGDSQVGDMRMTAALQEVPKNMFQTHKNWNSTKTSGKATGLEASLGARYPGADGGVLVNGALYMGGSQTGGGIRWPGIPSRVTAGVRRADNGLGDWDTGIGVTKDGAYINKADEGDMQLTDLYAGARKPRIPYIQKDDHMASKGTVFSPTRQIPSSMMLGSIPTGIWSNHPWQTLLFCPKPEETSTKHPGKSPPSDHLIADLFWMPVVEPYAISQPFSTAGKINMNYQIQPFTYITRSTGVRAVMKSTKFLAVKVADSSVYKPAIEGGALNKNQWISGTRRYSINLDATMTDFQKKFDTNNEIFKSATQICEMNLIPAKAVPSVTNSAGMATFWNANTLTGDNVREKPYVDIYPRLTTKSNTYTVHIRVQSLQKVKGPGSDPSVFVDPNGSATGTKDVILSEYRGSAIIERYIDPNDPALPDFAALFASNPSDPDLNIDKYYKFRVVSTKRFAP